MKPLFLLSCLSFFIMSCASKKTCMPESYDGWLQMQEDLRLRGKEYNPDDYRHCYDGSKPYYPKPPEDDWSIISIPAADPYRNQIKD